MTLEPERCVTCGDEAVVGVVVETRSDTATVTVAGVSEQVATELVAPVEAGDLLLCHAGIALQKVAP